LKLLVALTDLLVTSEVQVIPKPTLLIIGFSVLENAIVLHAHLEGVSDESAILELVLA